MKVEALTGEALREALPAVARLRIEVFRAWPYLYDGDLAYEENYLRPYAESSRAIVVVARDGARLVGASTGAPLTEHADDFAAAFAGSGLEMSEVFYCAESVLLPGYRGRGVGHAFFDEREAHARRLGFPISAFCSVIRPRDHPKRPADYRPLDPFWRSRGYEPLDGVVAEFSWRDLDQEVETAKRLQFWYRRL